MQSAQQFGEILGIGLPELVVILVIVLLGFFATVSITTGRFFIAGE